MLLRKAVCFLAYNRPLNVEYLDNLIEFLTSSGWFILLIQDGLAQTCPALASHRQVTKALMQLEKRYRPSSAVELIVRENNLGLRENVCSSLDTLAADFDFIFCHEDDLRITNEGLKWLANCIEKIPLKGQIGLWNSAIISDQIPGFCNYILTYETNCWAWGVHSKIWKQFRSSSFGSFNIKEPPRRSILDLVYPYRLHLAGNIVGEVSTWAIYWHYFLIANDLPNVQPLACYVNNDGYHSGSNSSEIEIFYDRFKVPLGDVINHKSYDVSKLMFLLKKLPIWIVVKNCLAFSLPFSLLVRIIKIKLKIQARFRCEKKM